MALRNWRLRRVLLLCAVWPVLVLVGLAIDGYAQGRAFVAPNNNADVYLAVHVPLGPWLWLGPPLLLLITWWAVRRFRPAG